MAATLPPRAFPCAQSRLLGRPAWIATILLLAWLPALSYLDHLPSPTIFDAGESVSRHASHSPKANDSTVAHGPTTASHSAHGHGDSGGLGSGAVPLILDVTAPTPELPAPVLVTIASAKRWTEQPAIRPATPPPR